MEIELSGIIKIDHDLFDKISLLNPDGYKIDLIGRFQEIQNSFPSKSVQVSYYLSDVPAPRGVIMEGFMAHMLGAVDASYEANHYNYSEWTSGTDYDSELKIGGHSLFDELMSEQGRFIYLIITVLN